MADDSFEFVSDLDFAFRLQLQEALAASLTLQPSSSAAGAATTAALSRLGDLGGGGDGDRGRVYNQRFTAEIAAVSDDEGPDRVDHLRRPFGEGSSSSSASVEASTGSVFRLYFKGLVSEEGYGGIGIAIIDDDRDRLIFEDSKPLFGNELVRQAAEAKALVEGLQAALDRKLSRIVVFFDSFPLFRFVSGKWIPRQRKVAELVHQAKILQRRFTECSLTMLARNDIRFAFRLARDAIESQRNRSAESSHRKNQSETCVICLEDNEVTQIFSVNNCLHRYCFSCMKQHVEYKLRNAQAPKCPHQGCNSELDIASCENFLTPKFMEIMRQREKEAATPVADRVYCPHPRCSVLMSKTEVLENSRQLGIDVDRLGARSCVKCNAFFCVNCKVPWHRGMTCSQYKMLNPNPPAEDTKLKLLASQNLWRQCKKCNLIIELAEGCYHMTCRCGFEFCYNCGAEWKDKKATCSCPLWDEDNIWHDQDRDSDEDEDEEEEEEEYDEDDYESESEIHYNPDFDVYYVL